MEKKTLKQRIKENPGLKQAVHRFIMHPELVDTALRFHIPETRKGFCHLSECTQRPPSFQPILFG